MAAPSVRWADTDSKSNAELPMPLAPSLFVVVVEEMPHICLDPEQALASEPQIGAGSHPEVSSRTSNYLPDAYNCKPMRPFVSLAARPKTQASIEVPSVPGSALGWDDGGTATPECQGTETPAQLDTASRCTEGYRQIREGIPCSLSQAEGRHNAKVHGSLRARDGGQADS